MYNYSGQLQKTTGRAENDFLPHELMVTLRQTAVPAEYLGPPGSVNPAKLLKPPQSVKENYFRKFDMFALILYRH